MISWRSLEFRITAWYALFLFVLYFVFSAGLWLIVRHSIGSAVDELLRDRAERLVELVSSEAEVPEEVEEEIIEFVLVIPEGNLARIRDASGGDVATGDEGEARLPWPVAGNDGRLETVTVDGSSYRLLVRQVSALGRRYDVLLASSLEVLSVVRDRFTMSFLLVTPAALLFCSLGGLWIARHALAPLSRIADTASSITVGSLSRRIDVPPTGDALERLGRAFNDMLTRLEASVDRLEQFSADASHELRTPLSVIRATAELALRHGRTKEEYEADLRDVHAQAVRLSELVDVLLTLSRKGILNGSVPTREVDLSELARAVGREFEGAIGARGLTLKLETPESGPALVRANESALRRLVASLVENALAHTSQGSITLAVEVSDAWDRLVVRDTGGGIPEDALEKIFDRFYRVDASRTPSEGRFGLGLSIARQIAELHGAELTVSSRLGEGSSFLLTFRR